MPSSLEGGTLQILANATLLTVAITFNTAANAKSLSDLVMPVLSAMADTKSAFLKLTTSSPAAEFLADFFADDFFFAVFLTAYSAVLDVDVARDVGEVHPLSSGPRDGVDVLAGAVDENATTVDGDARAAMAATQRRSDRRIMLSIGWQWCNGRCSSA